MKNDVNKLQVGHRIKSLRTSKGMTLEEFGEIFKPVASKSIVSRWESGKSIPNNERLKTIANYFGVSTMYLLYGEITNEEDSFLRINTQKYLHIEEIENLKLDDLSLLGLRGLETYIDLLFYYKKTDIGINLGGLPIFLANIAFVDNTQIDEESKENFKKMIISYVEETIDLMYKYTP